MIQIDMPMPESCIDCPFKEQEYGEGECLADKEKRCTYGDSSGRQEWCPLKEQKTKTQGADSGMCEICSFYKRAMPVKPYYNARTNWYECGACKFSMTSGMHCKGELIPAYKVGFCAKCGQAVKWDEM